MIRVIHNAVFCVFFTVIALSGISPAAATDHQYYEVRSYILGETGNSDAIDQYLSEALLPALARQKVGPVGVFSNSENDASGSSRVIVVIPYSDASQLQSGQRIGRG